jgi:hypothetical protein
MPYIKVNADDTVTLGGALLHETAMSEEGWFLYEGEVFEYSKWDAKENKVIPNVPPLTMLLEKVQKHINKAASELGYDDITSAVSYLGDGSNITYSLQGQKLKKFRTEVWDYFFTLYDLAMNGDELIDLDTFTESLPKADTAVSSEEVARAKRDILLRESDLLVMVDRWQSLSAEQQKALADYRTALRELPMQEGFPETITWPTKP